MAQRREITVAVALCLLGAFALLIAARLEWVSYFAPIGRSATKTYVQGESTPVARALGLAALAGVVGIAAARGRGRILVGGVLALIGIGAAIVGVRAGLTAIPLPDQTGTVRGVDPESTAWPWVAAAGGVLVCAAGVLVTLRGAGWRRLAERYDGPQPTHNSAVAPTESALWDAQSRGEDPT